jgi:glycosyltransferase involved in cell wall biosynthesis
LRPTTAEGRRRKARSGAGTGAVVQVVGGFPPDLGGTEKVAERLAVSLAAHRPVVVVTSRSKEKPGREAQPYPASMEVTRLPAWRVAQIPFMPTLAWRLLRLSEARLYHLHLAQAYVPEMAWLASRLTGRPLVIHFHLDVEPSSFLGPVFVLYKRALLARVLRSADIVVALNDAQVTTLTSRYGVDPGHIRVIPNGVPIPLAVPDDPAPREAVDDESGPFRLLFVGRLSAQKNLPRLLAALSLVEYPVVLDIVGDGSERGAVELEIGRRRLANVRLLGPRHDEALIQCYRRAQALVLTSDHEGMPLVLLEAMACGLPVVATDVPGVRETVGSAALLAAPEPQAVADAIDRLAGDRELREKLSRLGRERAAASTWSATVEAVERVYEELGA